MIKLWLYATGARNPNIPKHQFWPIWSSEYSLNILLVLFKTQFFRAILILSNDVDLCRTSSIFLSDFVENVTVTFGGGGKKEAMWSTNGILIHWELRGATILYLNEFDAPLKTALNAKHNSELYSPHRTHESKTFSQENKIHSLFPIKNTYDEQEGWRLR